MRPRDQGSLRTSLCERLGIQYPIIKAPMAGGTDTVDLVAAVSAAGGLGVLGAILLAPDELRATIRAIRERTDRPFGVNLVVHRPQATSVNAADVAAVQRCLDPVRAELGLPDGPTKLALQPSDIEEQFQVVCDERVPVVHLMGDPTDLVLPAREAGFTVMTFVSTVSEAHQAIALGVDIIVAQGAEAGGLRCTWSVPAGEQPPLIGLMTLLPQVVDATPPSVPVVAAGGIMDGRGVLAALALGASGVMLGTRFALARESGIAPWWRARMREATPELTVVSSAFTGWPARAIANRLVAALDTAGVSPLPYPYQLQAMQDLISAARDRPGADTGYFACGQGIAMADNHEPAADIVAGLVAEATAGCRRTEGQVAV
ncbi:MAG: NAD(P)H-dependent flavin oxidoreductase [Thermomicrobiales bacterium]